MSMLSKYVVSKTYANDEVMWFEKENAWAFVYVPNQTDAHVFSTLEKAKRIGKRLCEDNCGRVASGKVSAKEIAIHRLVLRDGVKVAEGVLSIRLPI